MLVCISISIYISSNCTLHLHLYARPIRAPFQPLTYAPHVFTPPFSPSHIPPTISPSHIPPTISPSHIPPPISLSREDIKKGSIDGISKRIREWVGKGHGKIWKKHTHTDTHLLLLLKGRSNRLTQALGAHCHNLTLTLSQTQPSGEVNSRSQVGSN